MIIRVACSVASQLFQPLALRCLLVGDFFFGSRPGSCLRRLQHENGRVAECQLHGRVEQDAIAARANIALVGTGGAERKSRIAVEPID